MTIPARFEFTTNAKLQAEAMISGTQALMKGPHRIIWTGAGLVFTALMALGGAALAIAICYNLNTDPGLWMVFAGVAAGALYLTHQQLILSSLAKQAAQKPLNEGLQTIVLSDQGVTLETGGATWFTPWDMIDSARESKSAVLVSTGGIAFSIPKAVIGDAEVTKTLIQEISSRLRHA